MRFNEKDFILNYQVFVTISEKAYDQPLLNNVLQQRYCQTLSSSAFVSSPIFDPSCSPLLVN